MGNTIVECSVCDSIGFVCENHNDRPWRDGGSKRDDACDCGAGAPCPTCNSVEGVMPRLNIATVICSVWDE